MTHRNSGCLVVVVGPSGSGKDSLLHAAKAHFSLHEHVQFVKRVITRECDPQSEIHDSVTHEEFLVQKQQGAFSIWWQANGLYYGLPASVHTQLNAGKLLIVNGSRAAIPEFRQRFTELAIVSVNSSASVLAERLTRRNRESHDDILKRLQRNERLAPLSGSDVTHIENNGELAVATSEFIETLNTLL